MTHVDLKIKYQRSLLKFKNTTLFIALKVINSIIKRSLNFSQSLRNPLFHFFFCIFGKLKIKMEEENVILVNLQDEQIGLMPKMEAHQKAVLHRAFSVFVLNPKNEILLQQRAQQKYHSPLLWTNTCCSHQRNGETNIQAGNRRLFEEMGFNTELKELFHFIYKAPFDNGLTEHELDHVMIGYYDEAPKINTDEVENWKWMGIEEVRNDIQIHPEIYTVWFKIIFDEFYHFLEEHKSPLTPKGGIII